MTSTEERIWPILVGAFIIGLGLGYTCGSKDDGKPLLQIESIPLMTVCAESCTNSGATMRSYVATATGGTCLCNH